jgi:hypothetical protein
VPVKDVLAIAVVVPGPIDVVIYAVPWYAPVGFGFAIPVKR